MARRSVWFVKWLYVEPSCRIRKSTMGKTVSGTMPNSRLSRSWRSSRRRQEPNTMMKRPTLLPRGLAGVRYDATQITA